VINTGNILVIVNSIDIDRMVCRKVMEQIVVDFIFFLKIYSFLGCWLKF
jgi:hypothetical protein